MTLILSFRDLSTASCSAVTAGAFYDVAGYDWDPHGRLSIANWSQVRLALARKNVLFCIHGFNVDRDSGIAGFGAFVQELQAGTGVLENLAPPIRLVAPQIDVAVPVLWAGDWYLPVNYPFLLPDVRLTGQYFAEMLLGPEVGARSVSFLTHSMGARVVLETIQQMTVRSAEPPLIPHVILTAPATSDEVLDDPAYAGAVKVVQQFTVVSSRADTVLSQAFPAGNAAEQALWANDPGANDALGRYGPRLTPDSAALGKTMWYEIPETVGQNHGDYVPDPLSPEEGWPNGWSGKRVRIGALAKAVLGGAPFADPPASPVVPISSDSSA